MTTTNDLDRDADFEAELRTMLQRRAGDVRPSGIRVSQVIRLDGGTGHDQRGRHRVAVIAAAVALVAGAAGLATSVAGDEPTEPPYDTLTVGAPVPIWPLGDVTPIDQLATPESATGAYLAEVARLGPDMPLGRTEVQGAEATVHYTLGGIAARVTLTQRNGLWHVTGAANDLIVIDRVTPPEDTEIDVDVKPGSATAPVERLRASLVPRDGQVNDTADVEFEDGERVDSADPPLADGLWQTYLHVVPATEPVAVRVDVVDPDTGDQVLAHASVPVPGAPDVTALGAATPTTTEQPRTTVDPDPEPLPAGSDRLAVLVTDGATGDQLDLGGWQDAATALINTVVDDTSPPGPPVFTDVSQDARALTVRGRYSMPDGDAGTFELVRLDDGRWAMTSLRSDVIEVVEAGRTGSRIQVTLVSTKDAELGVGGNLVGWSPGEPYVGAGRKAVFSVPCSEGAATLYLFLDAHDGTNLRIAEAWPC